MQLVVLSMKLHIILEFHHITIEIFFILFTLLIIRLHQFIAFLLIVFVLSLYQLYKQIETDHFDHLFISSEDLKQSIKHKFTLFSELFLILILILKIELKDSMAHHFVVFIHFRFDILAAIDYSNDQVHIDSIDHPEIALTFIFSNRKAI